MRNHFPVDSSGITVEQCLFFGIFNVLHNFNQFLVLEAPVIADEVPEQLLDKRHSLRYLFESLRILFHFLAAD